MSRSRTVTHGPCIHRLPRATLEKTAVSFFGCISKRKHSTERARCTHEYRIETLVCEKRNTSSISSKRLFRILNRSSPVVKSLYVVMNTLWTSLSFARSCVSVIKRSTNPSSVPASTVPSGARRSTGCGSRAAASSKPPELFAGSLSELWPDPVDADPTLAGLPTLPGLDGEVMLTCSKRRDASLEEEEGDICKNGGGRDLSDQSG